MSPRDEVIAAMRKLVPAHGPIEVEVAGERFRLSRGPDGDVVEMRINDSLMPTSANYLWVVPYVRADQAEVMGRQAFEQDKPVTDNPFPFNPDQRDERRLHWEKGWRASRGGDGDGDTDD